MKKMWKKAIGIICAGGLSVMCLAGCGKDATGSPEIPTQEIKQNNVVDGAQVNKENDAPLEQGADNNAVDNGSSGSVGDGAFYDGANLQGSVVEFSDEGFFFISGNYRNRCGRRAGTSAGSPRIGK